ncbi:LysE family transporter [Metasolibacillus sp. FSL H7-0170]|uniref:LysE/ArgO family amino acid transporter n=1 Tax=Metasolibacillus sp. FSL H7-0170 TaxID=2921431 RepID=UPI00315837D3
MQGIIHGIILAFGLILPLGVQNVFVFSQGAMQPSKFKALPAVFTAALCDTLLILLAVLGLSVIVYQFEWLRLGLISGGILFLIYMGRVLWTAKAEATQQGEALPAKKQILFALSVSLLNPHAILDTVGVIGTSALNYIGTEKMLFTITCIIVSWLWFIALMFAGSMLKKVDASGKVMYIFNKCSAVFIWGTAVYLLIGLF